MTSISIYDSTFPQIEDAILQFWDSNNVKKISHDLGKEGVPFILEDGPPFCTGLPHMGHIMVGSAKDAIIKFFTMTGRDAKRDVGFDCHGVPIEMIVEKALKITKKDLATIGEKKYNDECRKNILNCVKDWKTTMNRIPRWVDYDKMYLTSDPKYMETEWWIFKELFNKGLVYFGNKVMPYSTGCNTPLSNFEAGLNYKDVKEKFVYVSFPVIGEEYELLVWTTTPWTLPSNLAICVHPEMKYSLVTTKDSTGKSRKYIVATSLVTKLFHESKTEKIFDGRDLENLPYKPLFNYVKDDKCFIVVCDKFVTETSGTGLVHMAPAFGEEDYRVCMDNFIIAKNEPVFCPVDDHGNFTEEVKDYVGKYIKTAEEDIIQFLKKENRLFRTETSTHSYPYCWRTDTPLIYKIVPAWFIDVPAIKERLIAVNHTINWQPEHIKHGKFGEWLKNVKPWCVSRSRIWGTPLPIWVSGDDFLVIGSIDELNDFSGIKPEDLHSDHIKLIEFDFEGKHYKWCNYVFDCWFDSGCEPYSRVHYPFENKESFEKSFPVDLVVEGIDQTRGWFYVLLVISTALFDKPAFKNVITVGIIQAEDGQKMAKSKNNYTDPLELIKLHGADALRLYLLGSPVLRGDELKFSDAGVKLVVQNVLLQWYNAFKFFGENYKKYIECDYKLSLDVVTDSILDTWIINKYNQLYTVIINDVALYKLSGVYDHIYKFVNYLTNFYIKLNRDALKGKLWIVEWHKSLATLYTVLYHMIHLLAPFAPFLTEAMYQELKKLQDNPEDSVHYNLFLGLIPVSDKKLYQADCMMKVIEMIREIRGVNSMSTRTPLKSITVCAEEQFLENIKETESYIMSSCNVLEIKYGKCEDHMQYVLLPNMKIIGKKFLKNTKNIVDYLNSLTSLQVERFIMDTGIDTQFGKISEEDVVMNYDAKNEIKNSKDCKYLVSKDVLVMCDTTKDETVMDMYHARLFATGVQRMRKLTKLKPWNKIIVYYETESKDMSNFLGKMYQEINKIIDSKLKEKTDGDYLDKPIITKELEVNNCKITVTLVHEV